MAKKSRVKAPAIDAPQNYEECALMIARFGQLQRERDLWWSAQQESVDEINLKYAAEIEPLSKEIAALAQGIQTYCEANRSDLCGARTKSAWFPTGIVKWRLTPYAANVRKKDEVIAALKHAGLFNLIRKSEAVDKETILATPEMRERAARIDGITITRKEEFVIEPDSPNAPDQKRNQQTEKS